MSRADQLRVGLWIRMALACLLALSGIVLVLATELVIAGLLGTIVAETIPVYGALGLALALAGVVLLGIWWLSASVLEKSVSDDIFADRIAHDGMADAVAGVRRWFVSPTRTLPPTMLAGLAGVSLVLLLAHQLLLERLNVSSFQLGAVVGCGVVVFQSARLVSREFRQDSAVHTTLTDEFRVLAHVDDQAELEAQVRRLATQAGVPTPTVEVVASKTPIAATVGYRPSGSTILVSRGLLEVLDDREREAVLAHELAHISNRDAAIMTALALPAAKAKALLNRFTHPLLLVVIGPVYASSRLCVALVGRHREYVADRSATELTGDPAALASALESLSREHERRPSSDLREHRSTAAFAIVPPPWTEHRFFDRTRRFVACGLLGTHPPTVARIERLRSRTETIEFDSSR
ncbi:M48 family metalloprotease [Halomontanus rarus]|uniref:M48 family metalloprotease n=1 Tax=Halomontanus rarus TaxID=3034020 RepID=UPI001A98D496